jgi:hypothetical protein
VTNNQKNAIKIMEKKHDNKRNKRTVSFSVGEMVSVSIPPIDRVGTDFPRLPCVISEQKGDFYQLVCKFGILNICYRADDLENYSGEVGFDFKNIKEHISLRAAAQAFNQRNVDKSETIIACNCNGKCLDRRCNCFSKNVKCNSHCHLKSRTNICCNKSK